MYSLSVILPPQISAFLFSYEWKRKIKKSYCELVQIGPKLLQLVGEFYA